MKVCAVIVFAKAPQPGQAKTRLIPALGASGAARLAERLLLNALEDNIAKYERQYGEIPLNGGQYGFQGPEAGEKFH